MTPEAMRAAAESGHASAEWLACAWAWDYAEAHLSLPSGKEVRAGVRKDYKAIISEASAYRGRDMASTLIFRVCFARQAAGGEATSPLNRT